MGIGSPSGLAGVYSTGTEACVGGWIFSPIAWKLPQALPLGRQLNGKL